MWANAGGMFASCELPDPSEMSPSERRKLTRLSVLDSEFISKEFGPSSRTEKLKSFDSFVRQEPKPIQHEELPIDDVELPVFSPAKPRKEINRRQILLRYPEYDDIHRIRFEGWVNIKRIAGTSLQPSSLRKPSQWKYRYCELERNCLFQYRMTPKGQFVLSPDSVIESEQNDHSSMLLSDNQLGYELSISSLKEPTKKKILFAALSRHDLIEWTKALEEGKTNDSVRKKGTLFCCSNFRQKWKPYDVLLAGAVIQLFSRDHQHAFNLYGCLLEKSSRFANVLSLSNNMSTIYIYLRIEENLNAWYQKLEQEIATTNHSSDDLTDSSSNLTAIDPNSAAEYITFSNDIKEMIGKGKVAEQNRRALFVAAKPEFCSLLASSETRKPYLILSLDGGGIRGILSLVMLERIQQHFHDILDHVQLFAGTSTGSIIASGLSFGHSPASMRAMFENKGSYIFSNPLSKFKNVSQAKFENKWMKCIVEETYGNMTLSDCPSKLLISAFLLNNGKQEGEQSWEPKLYHNLGSEEETNKMKITDLVLFSTAAPTFFPSVKKHIDGAVFDQNPAMSALTLAISPRNGNIPLSEIAILSLGTGKVMRWVDEEEHNWGIGQWLPKLTNLLWDGMVLKSELHCKELVGDRFHRCDALLMEEIPMDDPSTIPAMTAIVNAMDMSETLQWIANTVYHLPFYDDKR